MSLERNDLETKIVLTLDTDWAPDWMIDDVASRLARLGVKATFFATNESKAVRSLEQDAAFEVGVHPNFLPGSSHGSTPDKVLAHMRGLFPGARAVRTHSLTQSEPLLSKIADNGYSIDCSIHLPRVANITPHVVTLSEGGTPLVRVPHIFQDNMHMLSKLPWDAEPPWLATPGWKVLNFHPVHVVLNSESPARYEAVKKLGRLSELRRSDLSLRSVDEPGAGFLFQRLIERLSGTCTTTISESVAHWQAEAS